MLRCVVYPEGRQQILASAPKYELAIDDLRALNADGAAARVDATRARLSHKVHASDQWPLFEFRVSLLNEQISRLHISADLLIGDGRSFEIVFQELMQLYGHPETVLPPLELSFRDYLYALNSLEQTEAYRESRKYWMDRVPSLPACPELPLEKTSLLVNTALPSNRQSSAGQLPVATIRLFCIVTVPSMG